MKHLWIIILNIISFTVINSQDGLWEYAWQNDYNNLCVPDLIYIAKTSDNEGIISYEYNLYTYRELCPESMEWEFSRYIAYNNDLNVWEDTYAQQISYNADTNILTFSTNGKSVWYQPNEIISANIILNKDNYRYEDTDGQEILHDDDTRIVTFSSPGKSVWYRPNKTSISFGLTEATLGGNWIKQSELNSIDNCYHPNFIYMATSSSYRAGKSLKLIYNVNYTTQLQYSEDNTQKIFYTLDSSPTTINFADDLMNPTTNISFTPSIADNILTLISSHTSCSSTYIRSNNFTALNGTWIRDRLQSERGGIRFYKVEEITNNNIRYMKSSYCRGCVCTGGYVIQTPEGTYYDTSLEDTFTYNQFLNTIRFSKPKHGLFSNGYLFIRPINWIYELAMKTINYVKSFDLYYLYQLVFG